MGYFKFTSFKTGKTYDSRGDAYYVTEYDEHDRKLKKEVHHKPSKDIWIDDPELADVLGCNPEEIQTELDSVFKKK